MTSRRDPLRPPVALPALALAAAGSALLGLWAGVPWLLPILNAAPAWAVMAFCIARGRRGAAAGLMLWWALCLGLATTLLCAADPWGTAAATVWNGPAYLGQMRAWVESGSGCESSPACFVPEHLKHAAIFAAVGAATAGAGALLMGALLMNYMAFYVGRLAAASAAPAATALLAWPPWSLIRIAAFVALGVVLAEPLIARATRRPMPPGRLRWIAVAVAGLAADIALKALLAPAWSALLRRLVAG